MLILPVLAKWIRKEKHALKHLFAAVYGIARFGVTLLLHTTVLPCLLAHRQPASPMQNLINVAAALFGMAAVTVMCAIAFYAMMPDSRKWLDKANNQKDKE